MGKSQKFSKYFSQLIKLRKNANRQRDKKNCPENPVIKKVQILKYYL